MGLGSIGRGKLRNVATSFGMAPIRTRTLFMQTKPPGQCHAVTQSVHLVAVLPYTTNLVHGEDYFFSDQRINEAHSAAQKSKSLQSYTL